MCLSLPIWCGESVVRVAENGHLERVGEVGEEKFLLLEFCGLVQGPNLVTPWSCVLVKSEC